jgi:hypothetical protein
MATLKTKILHRNDTTANWTSNNPVLSKGEFGIEWITSGASGVEGSCKVKIGDGFTPWNDLNYIGGDASIITTSGEGNTVIGVSSTTDANGVITYTLKLGDRLTGGSLTANTILLGNGGLEVKTSSKTIVTTLGNDNTTVPTSKAVADAISTHVSGAVQYLGTISAVANLSTTAGKGDFYRASADVKDVWHAGDIIIAEQNNPSKNVDGTNWSVIHGENVGVTDVAAGTGITVDKTNAAVPKINVKLKDSTVQTKAAVAVSSATDRTYAIQVNSDNQLVVNVPWTNTDRSSLAYCTTAAATAAKVATMPGFALSSGQYIFLRTTVTNSATSSVTLNVNSTGAKPVKIGSSAVTASNFQAGDYLANYDGTNWVLTRIYFTDSNTNVSHSGIGICSTAAATAAKAVTFPNFALVKNQNIIIRVNTTNSATSGVTLNVNSTGAKSVYIGGSA